MDLGRNVWAWSVCSLDIPDDPRALSMESTTSIHQTSVMPHGFPTSRRRSSIKIPQHQSTVAGLGSFVRPAS